MNNVLKLSGLRATSLNHLHKPLTRNLATTSLVLNSENSNNNNIHTHVKNRNPMNLEKMRIGYKPTGFKFERRGQL